MSLLDIYSKKDEAVRPQKDLYTNVYSKFTYHSPNVKTTQMPLNR